MSTKGKRPMRALTAGDKIEAIQRVNDGESKASVARDIGVPESTLRGWCKNEDKLRYMSSRRSSPDTQDSDEPPDKRPRASPSVSPPAPATPATLDLSATATTERAPTPSAPIQLTKPKEPRPDVGANVSMSAISPLTGLGHLPGLSHSHLGMSFNDIAANLNLIAQLNPSLTALTSGSGAKGLRSVRSPKPSQPLTSADGALNLSDKGRSRHHSSHSDSYRSKGHSMPKDTMDEALWYWLKTQQAMLDLTAHASRTPTRSPKENGTHSPKPIAPIQPVNPLADYNRNTWFWQYYKQFGGAMPLPDDKHRSASQVPKEKTDILYSHLTKAKPMDPVRPEPENLVTSVPAPSPEKESSEKQQVKPTKARNVLDNLLFNNNNSETSDREAASGEWEAGTAEAMEALQHGDKFLAWLEACGDPSVTRVHLHQLRALLGNLRARRPALTQPHGQHVAQPLSLAQTTTADDRSSRRK